LSFAVISTTLPCVVIAVVTPREAFMRSITSWRNRMLAVAIVAGGLLGVLASTAAAEPLRL
jgi:hypothetical protein